MNWLIYKHTCTTNNKGYIGLTKNLSKRTTAHRLKSSKCRIFRNAIQKHGWDRFVTEILAINLSLEEANVLEQNLIKEHNTIAPYGYNIKPGGEVHIITEETRKRMQP